MASNDGPRRPDSQVTSGEDENQTSTTHQQDRRPHQDAAPYAWVEAFTAELIDAASFADIEVLVAARNALRHTEFELSLIIQERIDED